MKRWYVIHTKSTKEEEVKSYLTMKGLEIFNPLIETLKAGKGRMHKELKPFFPNYIFGKFDPEENYRLVKWAQGVKRILGFGGFLAPVSEEVIELIKKRTDSGGVVRNVYHFEPNELVRIKSGPLRDLLGIFERWVSDRERVRILLNLVGYQPAIELHCTLIEKVA